MRDLGWIIEANAHAAGRELAHAQSDGNQDAVEAIGAAQDEEIEQFCTRDHAKLIIESPAADLSFLAFNRGRRLYGHADHDAVCGLGCDCEKGVR